MRKINDTILKTIVPLIFIFILLFPSIVKSISSNISIIPDWTIRIIFILIYILLIVFYTLRYGKTIYTEMLFKLILFPIYILYIVIFLLYYVISTMKKVNNIILNPATFIILSIISIITLIIALNTNNIYYLTALYLFNYLLVVWLIIWFYNASFKPLESMVVAINKVINKLLKLWMIIVEKSQNINDAIKLGEATIDILSNTISFFTRYKAKIIIMGYFSILFMYNLIWLMWIFSTQYMIIDNFHLFKHNISEYEFLDYIIFSLYGIFSNVVFKLSEISIYTKLIVLSESVIGIMLFFLVIMNFTIIIKRHSKDIHSRFVVNLEENKEKFKSLKINIIQ